MHQFSAVDSNDCRSLIRLHEIINYSYDTDRIIQREMPFKIYKDKWYHARFVITKGNYRLYLKELSDNKKTGMKLVTSYEYPRKDFNVKFIGVKASSSEHAEVANIVLKQIENERIQ